MTRFLKEFIEEHIDLIESENWRKIFVAAYDEALTTPEVQELSNIVFDLFNYDATQLRNDLLYEYIAENLKFIKRRIDKNNGVPVTVAQRLAAQFLRSLLNNTFGFTEQEALKFMYDNQANFGITLKPVGGKYGQHSIDNFEIIFNN